MDIIFLSKKKIKRRNEIGSIKRVSVAILEKSNLSTASNHTADGLDILQKSILRRFSGMELNIICTTVSAEVMLSFRTHSSVIPTAPIHNVFCATYGRRRHAGSLLSKAIPFAVAI